MKRFFLPVPFNTSFINAFNPILIALVVHYVPICDYGRQVAGFLLSLAGVIWIIFKGDPLLILSLTVNAGDLFMFGSIVAWSAHTILYKKNAVIFSAQSLFVVMMR